MLSLILIWAKESYCARHRICVNLIIYYSIHVQYLNMSTVIDVHLCIIKSSPQYLTHSSPQITRWPTMAVARSKYAARRGFASLLCPNAESASKLESRLRPLLPSAAASLLGNGMLERIVLDKKSQLDVSAETRRLIASSTTVEEKHEAAVAMSFISRRISMLLKGYCDVCMYTQARCVCSAVNRVRSKHTMWLFQHVGEYGRANNSGRLLCLMLGARITTQGLRSEVDEMLQHAEDFRDSSVVLFPTPDSVTIEEYCAQRAARIGQQAAEASPLTIFLPDGTSNQAKNLEKHLPAYLPRVRLNTSSMRSWLDPIRRQTEEHRVCTAQAAAALLAELGEPEVTNEVKALVDFFVKLTERDRTKLGGPEHRARPSLFAVDAFQ